MGFIIIFYSVFAISFSRDPFGALRLLRVTVGGGRWSGNGGKGENGGKRKNGGITLTAVRVGKEKTVGKGKRVARVGKEKTVVRALYHNFLFCICNSLFERPFDFAQGDTG